MELIIAPATPNLVSALSIIRISGDGAFEATDKLFDKKVTGIKSRTSFLGTLSYKEDPIDQVVLLAYPSPRSYTGEEVVEIICHGSPLIVKEITEAYIALGAREAGPGEFTARAYYNGKMDLVRASAVDDLIKSLSHESKRLALLSLEGKSSALLIPIKEDLGELLSLIEVNIDYPEYSDLEEANSSQIESKAKEIRAKLASLIKKSQDGAVVSNGIKAAIVGEPNVGKSTLLNAFLDSEKAIVSPIPGTTRDIVEGEAIIGGLLFRFLDTAGLRKSEDMIENLGIKKSREALEEADLVIYVHDASRKEESSLELQTLLSNKLCIDVYNKSDLARNEDGKLYISALNKDISPLIEEIKKKLNLSKDVFDSPSLYSKREIGLLKRMDEELEGVLEDIAAGAPIDLVSNRLLTAYNLAREILGEEIDNDLSGEIFSRFCVGK